MSIAEPAVTLTDYGLTIECLILAFMLKRLKGTATANEFRNWFIVFFCALGAAALLGGTSHGFIREKTSLLHTAVWNSTLIAIGTAGLAAWMIGGCLAASEKFKKWLTGVAVILFVINCAVVVFLVNTFLVAIIFYLPATLFLFIVFLWRFLKRHSNYSLSGISGLLLTFVAAGIQQLRIAMHPIWFDHNALYHLIQAVALLLLFLAARGFIRKGEAET